MNFGADVRQLLHESGVSDIRFFPLNEELKKIDCDLVLHDDVLQAPSLDVLHNAGIDSAVIKNVELSLHKMEKTLVLKRKKIPITLKSESPLKGLDIDARPAITSPSQSTKLINQRDKNIQGREGDARAALIPIFQSTKLKLREKHNALIMLRHIVDCQQMQDHITNLETQLHAEPLSTKAAKQLQIEIHECETNLKVKKAAKPKHVFDLNDNELKHAMKLIPFEHDCIEFVRSIGRADLDPSVVATINILPCQWGGAFLGSFPTFEISEAITIKEFVDKLLDAKTTLGIRSVRNITGYDPNTCTLRLYVDMTEDTRGTSAKKKYLEPKTLPQHNAKNVTIKEVLHSIGKDYKMGTVVRVFVHVLPRNRYIDRTQIVT